MSDELFPADAIAMDSPRLVWIKKHHCITFHSTVVPECWFAGFSKELIEDADQRAQWMFEELGANGSSAVGEGVTEDEAIADAAKKWAIKLWNEESP